MISSPTVTRRPVTILEPPAWRALRPFAAVRRLTHFADLFRVLSGHRIRVRYKQSRLGALWAVLQPLAMMVVFVLMFSLIGAAPSQGTPYPLFAYSALLPWTAFSTGLAAATMSLTSQATLMTKVYFPREILPLTSVTAALVDLALASIALVALMAWYAVPLTAHAPWAVVCIALLVALLCATGLLCSALQVRYRDVGLAMPVLLQVWMFTSPVLYPLAAVSDTPSVSDRLYAAYILNPMAGIVDGFRRSVVLGQRPDMAALGASAVVIVLLLPAAYLYFKHAERTMADVV